MPAQATSSNLMCGRTHPSVSKRVNTPKNNDSELIAPVATAYRNAEHHDLLIWSVDRTECASYIGVMIEEVLMSKPTPAIPLQQLSDALTDIVKRAAPSVVAVHSTRSRSSGFVWRPGLIVTADEALDDEGDIAVVLPGGETTAANLVGRDPTTDVALLLVDRTNLPPLTLASASVP